MRHFIVMGFCSNSQNDQGKQVHLGSDRGDAVAELNKDDGKFVRKELFELAVPEIRRCFIAPATTKSKKAKE
jgi:hypothetical protein